MHGRYLEATTFPVLANPEVAVTNSSTSSIRNFFPVVGQTISGYANCFAASSVMYDLVDFNRTTFWFVIAFRDTGHMKRKAPGVPEWSAGLSRRRLIGIKFFVRRGLPVQGLGGRFGGSLIGAAAACGVNCTIQGEMRFNSSILCSRDVSFIFRFLNLDDSVSTSRSSLSFRWTMEFTPFNDSLNVRNSLSLSSSPFASLSAILDS